MQLVEAAQHVPLVFSTSLFKFSQDHALHNSRRDSSSSAHTFPFATPCVDKISFPWIPHPTPSPYTFWEEKIVQKKFFHTWLICRFQQACKEHTCCAVWISFSDHRLLTKSGGREIFISHSSPDNEFSSPFECICGMPEWFITADSEVWQWAAEMTDGIFFLISFPWSSSSPGLCTSIN